MTTPNPDSLIPTPEPAPARRSDALEAELAMLEAILPSEGTIQPTPVDPAKDGRGA